MFRYLVRRILWAIVLFFAVTIVTYIIFFVIPADPARAFAGKNPTEEQIVWARHYLGIAKPAPRAVREVPRAPDVSPFARGAPSRTASP